MFLKRRFILEKNCAFQNKVIKSLVKVNFERLGRMKRLTVFVVSMLLIFIAGCGSDQLKVNLITPKTYTPGQVSPIKIKIFDDKGKPVKDANVSVEFDMQGMTMIPVSMTAKEIEDGVYIGNANLQMEGDYTAAIKVDKNGGKYEQEKRFSIVVSQ